MRSLSPFQSVEERMNALERFLIFWLGERRSDYGYASDDLDRIARVPDLPYPLHRFYQFAGRWPSPNYRPILSHYEEESEGYFYAGIQGHHLSPPSDLKVRSDGRLFFFHEQSGNWSVSTRTDRSAETDPPVWLHDPMSYFRPLEATLEAPEQLLAGTLSELLVTHCLHSLLYEDGNSRLSNDRSRRIPKKIVEFFEQDSLTSPWFVPRWLQKRRGAGRIETIWRASMPEIDYAGEYLLWRDCVLVHRTSEYEQFAARSPDGVDLLQKNLF